MNGSDKEFDIQRYNPSMAETWNRFVSQSKNGTFLFDRGYMDYHADRFQDFSLVFYRKGKMYALLPANIKDNVLYSHQGLTYGGGILFVPFYKFFKKKYEKDKENKDKNNNRKL